MLIWGDTRRHGDLQGQMGMKSGIKEFRGTYWHVYSLGLRAWGLRFNIGA